MKKFENQNDQRITWKISKIVLRRAYKSVNKKSPTVSILLKKLFLRRSTQNSSTITKT